MARRVSKHLRPARPLNPGHGVSADKSDGRWIVRTIPGAAAVKNYRCPGCQQVIPAGLAHIVAWPTVGPLPTAGGLDERRHWHSGCWQRRR